MNVSCNADRSLNRFPRSQFIFLGERLSVSVIFLLTLSTILSGCNWHSAPVTPAKYLDPHCPPIISKGIASRGDLIHSRTTATELATLITNDYTPKEQKKWYDGVYVKDTGRTWSIVQKLRHNNYGGGIVFDIDKCTGTIEGFHIDPD